ncbi:MAG: hypothetical protein GX454_02500 [Brooklawnia sp.]|nr:hypothetical protein [Brooklawnia sp.]
MSPFVDVATTDPGYAEIAWMHSEGISTGWPDGTYRPDLSVDRDAMAAFFYRFKDSPAFNPPATSPFTDITPSTQFYKEMAWMKATGISTGWPDGTYRPWTPTNRDAMAAFMYRVAGSPEYTPPTADQNPLTDIDPSIQFYKEMSWLHETGIAAGAEDGTFDPWQPVTRRMMAIFMYRLDHWQNVQVATTSLPSATVGQSYTATLQASGGTAPYTWQVASLPAGLSHSDGTISGTPTSTGQSTVNVTVRDAKGQTATKELVLSVVEALSITTNSLPVGAVGEAYSATLETSGGVPPATWTASGLPAGLALSAAGLISGTPSFGGNTAVTFVATDQEGRTASKELSFVIADGALTITTQTLPPSTVGDPYTTELTAAGGTAPYQWTITGLPAGFTASGAQISGTPTTAGTTSVSVTVKDAEDRDSTKSLDLVVSDPLVLGTTSLPPASVGVEYSHTLAASGGHAPYTWEVTGLPAGLSLNDGVISGTPTASGTFEVGVKVTDSDGRSQTAALSLVVDNALKITTTSLPAATLGVPYSTQLTAVGGTPPYTWAATGLPAGLSVNGNMITGTPTESGTAPFSVDVSVTDDDSTTVHAVMGLSVSEVETGLALLKTVVNPYGQAAAASNWTLAADGPGNNDLSGAGGVARTEVAPGTYTLSETGNVAGYTNGTEWTCATADGQPLTVTNNQVTLEAGADVTCTITNTARAPYLTLVKNVTNPYGDPAAASNWTLKADGPGSNDLSGAGGVARTAVVEGSYALSEIGSVAGYTNGTTWTCATAAGQSVPVTNNTVNITTGADVTCTITNTAAAPYLTLVKKVVNNDGAAAAASNWTLKADGPGNNDLSGAGGVARTQVVTGSYVLSETGSVAGYTNGTTWTCATSGGQPVTVTNNTVNLGAGADVTCTITNSASKPYLSLVKRVVNANGTPASASIWTLKADGPGNNDLAGAGGVARTAVVQGNYRLYEIGSISGYANGETWSCVDANGAAVPVNNNTVTIAAGADVTCSITNTAITASSRITPGTYSPTAVYRYFGGGNRDWVTVPDHGDFGVPSGYGSQSGPQYYVPLLASGAEDMVGIHRYYNASDRDWVDFVEGSYIPAGYASKTFQHYLFKSSGTNRVSVNRWWQPTDRDWITVSENEVSDATMQSWGYTNKTHLGYAHATQSIYTGYFSLGTPQAAVVSSSYAPGEYPHTMSVLDVNPTNLSDINAGYRYLGYFGHNDCGGINIARTNNLDSSSWYVGGHQPWFSDSWPCRWAFGAIADGSRIAMVVNGEWDTTVTLQWSEDGLDGTEFGDSTTLLEAAGTTGIGNPTLFRDPTNNRYYLYFYRVIPGTEYLYEIRVKSATSIDGLIGGGSGDLGTLIALSRNTLAAPSMMYANGTYYLAVETKESGVWKTRIMSGRSATGPFYEVPGNPLYGDGAACVFQHQFGTELHSWYCKQTQAGNESTWRLDHVKGNLLSPA